MESRTEKPIVLAVITLFITFVIVYMIFFRQDSVELEDAGGDEQYTTTIEFMTGGKSGFSTTFYSGGQKDTDGRVSLDSGTSDMIDDATIDVSNESGIHTDQIESHTTVIKNRVHQLSGIAMWYNSVKIAEILAMDVSFAFTDKSTAIYAAINTGSTMDATYQIIKRLGGNTVEIETENDINKNLLWGDRIVFVNIPGVTFVRKGTTEQKLLVAMIVDIDDDRRLLQIPYDHYHSSKQNMKKLFEQLYNKFL